MNSTNSSTTRRAIRLIGAVALVAGVAACSSDDDTSDDGQDDAEETVDDTGGESGDGADSGDGAGASEVSIVDFTFTPDPIEVSRGTTITWTNGDDVPHTVTGTGEFEFDSGSIGAGESFELLIEGEGEFPYVCTIHGQMSGSVIVS